MAEEKKLFFLPLWWGWMMTWGLGLLGVLVLNSFNAVDWTQDVATLALYGSGSLLAVCLLTNLLWLFSDRNRVVFQFVFIGLWGSVVMGAYLLARAEDYHHSLALMQEVEQTRIALRQQAVERAKRTQEERALEQERLRNDPFLQYRQAVSDEQLEQMRTVHEAAMAELKAARERYEDVLKENPVDGPEAWLRAQTLDELEVRRARHEMIYAAARDYELFLEGFRGRFEALLVESNFPPPADRFSVAEMERVLQFIENSGYEDIRRLDTEITTLALRAVNLLLDRWGEWRFDQRTSRVVFEKPGLELQFSQILTQAQMLAKAQREIERRVRGGLQ